MNGADYDGHFHDCHIVASTCIYVWNVDLKCRMLFPSSVQCVCGCVVVTITSKNKTLDVFCVECLQMTKVCS